MSIQFSQPVERAWQRMVVILFRPFALEKWIALGFAAWLAGLATGGPGGGFSWFPGDDDSDSEWHSLPAARAPAAALRMAASDPPLEVPPHFDRLEAWLPAAIGCALLIGIVLLAVWVVLLWVSSRASFVFLDDVVRNEARIAAPWRDYARLGNSLFGWRLLFYGGVLVVMALWIAGVFALTAAREAWPIVLWMMPLLVFGVVVAYADAFLRHFVVPIMYRQGLGAFAAWGLFLRLFSRHPLAFVAYGLLLVGLWIGVAFAILAAGLLTCCLGFVVLALPYVGTVALLPVLVFFRQLGLEFLRQFGPEFDLLEPLPGEAPAAA